MIRRSTLVAVVLFVIAVVALLVLQKLPSNPLQPSPTPAATSMPTLITGWQVQDVSGLSLKSPGGSEIGLTKNADNSWTRAQMGTVPAGKVEQLVSELIAVRVILQLPAGQNLTDLGLQSPVDTIQISGKNHTTILQIGGVTPTQSGYYVKVDTNPAAVVDKSAFDTILQLFSDAAPATPTPPVSPTTTASPP